LYTTLLHGYFDVVKLRNNLKINYAF